jgi:methyl-accepting chemotaxis protein
MSFLFRTLLERRKVKLINKIRNFSVIAKMNTGFGLLCLVILLLGITNLAMVKSISNASSAMSNDAFTTQLKSNNLSISVLLLGKKVSDLVAIIDTQLLAASKLDVQKNIGKSIEQIDDLKTHTKEFEHSDKISNYIETIYKNIREIEALAVHMYDLHSTNLDVTNDVRDGLSSLLLTSSELKQRISQDSRTKASNDIYVSELVTTVINRFSNIEFLVLKLVNTDNADELKEIVETIRFNTQTFNEDMADLQEEVPKLKDVSDTTDGFLETLVSEQGIIAAYFENRQLVAKLNDNLLTVSKKVTISDNALAAIREFGERNVVTANRQLEQTIGYSTTITIVIVAGALLLTIIISIMLSRMIKKPLERIIAKLQKMVNGDYSSPISDSFTGEFGELASSLNVLIEAMRKIISDLVLAAQEMSQVSESNSSGTKVVEDRLSAQNTQLNCSATAITEMEAAIAQVSDNMSRSLELTNSVDIDVMKGQKMMSENLSTIGELDLRMEESKLNVNDVTKMTPEITSIIQVIENVASKTNLLALNAAIEAARAGEHGRGFAVVADEVRLLSSLTAESTEKIRNMIVRLNDATQSASQSMDDSYKQLGNCKLLIEQASSEMDTIRDNVSSIRDNSQQINDSLMEQKSTALEISKSVNEINMVSDENATHIAGIRQNSNLLNQQMSVIDCIVKQFTIE